jgi:TetR/AcrR family transcriptional regulator, mexJK operon transcriptional repressor
MNARLAQGDLSGTRSKGRPKLEEAAAIDRAIREATVNALLEHGEAPTLHAVARAAGLSRKSVYARYSSKSELFLHVIRGLLEGAEGVKFDNAGDIQQRLFNYIQAALELMATPQSRAIQRLLTVDPAFIAALKSDMLNATHRHFFVPLRELLQQAHSSGELVVDDVEATTRILIRMIFAESLASENHQGTWLTSDCQESYAQFVTALVLRGLLPRTAEGI